VWPEGARCAVAFTFDFDADEVWIAEDPVNAVRPGVLSQGVYGAKVAVPLLLGLLDRHGVRATFFVPGRVAERYPERVAAIVAAGHEVGHHGYTHASPARLTVAEEEEALRRGLEALAALGARVEGYRSPSWDFGPNTLELLTRYGFRYSSNLMDDIRPYRHEGTPIVEVPVQWILDDAPHFWFSGADWDRKIATNEEVHSIWAAELAGIRELGGCCVFTMHPQIIGRPGRLRFLDAFIAEVRQDDGLWIATAGEIAARLEEG
jgi:peptidoglycan-N-acetylglucosamine deacetylase